MSKIKHKSKPAPVGGGRNSTGWRHPEAKSGELVDRPLNQLEPQEVQAILDSICMREPRTKANYNRYLAGGPWDMRIW